MEILTILWEGPSSAARIERQLDNVSLNLVSHHMKVLKELGCIELVETVSRRGATERIYRSRGPAIIDDEEWLALAPKMRQPVTAATLRTISSELARSIGAGQFEAIADNHLSHSLATLDLEGHAEIVEILARTLEQVLEAGDKSRKRVEESGETPMTVAVAILQFPAVRRRSDGEIV